jgi:hypothetical protein
VFGCKRKVVQRYDLGAGGGDQLDAGQAETKVPQDLLADAVLGEAPFQIRAAVIGELPAHGPEGVQQVATWKRKPPDPIGEALPDPRELGRVAIAQAEYFYALEHPRTPPADFMWSMRWQARLRRVQLPHAKNQAAERGDSDSMDENERAGVAELVPATPFGSLVEACDAVAAKLQQDDREDEEDEKERSPCAALARAVKTESLH